MNLPELWFPLVAVPVGFFLGLVLYMFEDTL